MSDHLPQKLLALLDELGLTGGIDARRLAGQVRHLARNLPVFESVWIDALLQARQITRFQAAEIQAGRGQRLRIGPYVLEERLPWPHYAAAYRARRHDATPRAGNQRDAGQREAGQTVRLLVIEAGPRTNEVAGRLEKLAARAVALATPGISPIVACGVGDRAEATEGGGWGAAARRGPRGAPSDPATVPPERRVWTASAWMPQPSAAHWMVRNGRFRPEVVLEIARQMAAALAMLESAKIVHGDICSQGLLLTAEGDAVLLEPGLRGIARPAEGYAHAELPPEAYDHLAPERVAEGGPPTLAADFYACGCLWWHMLCGRAPLTGGDGLTKLQAAHSARIVDARRFVPDAPAELSAALAACLAIEPGGRPASSRRLIDILGPPTPAGREALVNCLRQPAPMAARWIRPIENVEVPRRAPRVLVAVTCAVALIALAWGHVRQSGRLPTAARTVADAGAAPAADRRAAPPATSGRGLKAGGPAIPKETSNVRLVSATDDGTRATAVVPPEQRLQGDVLTLRDGRELAALLPSLKTGQTIRGPAKRRPRVVVPQEGLAIAVDGLHWENIDFVGPAGRPSPPSPAEPASLLRLTASQCEFRCCSFSGDDSQPRCNAVLWTYPAPSAGAAASLSGGQIEFRDCLLRNVDAAVDCRTAAALALRWSNTLLAETGPVVRLGRAPTVDEPLTLILTGITLRRTGPLLACRYQSLPPQPGSIQVRASLSALAPDAHAPLLLFQGPLSPAPLLEQLRWSGQGSLLAGPAPVAAWQQPSQPPEPLDDAAFAIEGLVRSDVEFAGGEAADPMASRVVRWQVPLRSSDPPGADPDLLPGAVLAAQSDLPPPPPPAAGRFDKPSW